MTRRLKQIFIGALSAVMLLPGMGMMQTRAETFTRSGNLLKYGDTIYFPNTMGGAKGYLPIELAKEMHNKKAIANGLLKLPGMRTDQGNKGRSAAFRYAGFNSYIGSYAETLVKVASVQTRPDGPRWFVPPVSVGDSHRLSFRYAGMVINGSPNGNTVPVIAGTNPYFPADTLQQSSNGGPQVDATVYEVTTTDDETRYSGKNQVVYGATGGVEKLEFLETNGMYNTSYFPDKSSVKTNRASGFNKVDELAELAFTRWAEEDASGYGAAYQAEAEDWIARTGSTLKWWQALNRIFQINGDPRDKNQSLYFYMVRTSGFYTTYTLGGIIERNVSPTLFAIKDEETGQILTESYRTVNDITSDDGVLNEVMGKPAELIPGHHYTVEAVMTYYSTKRSSSNSARDIQFYAINSGPEASPINIDSSMMSAYSKLPDEAAIIHKSPTDGKNSGTVTQTYDNTEVRDDNIREQYYYNGAAFASLNFTVPENIQDQQTGYLVVAVPQAAYEADDNQCQTDDTLYIRYLIKKDTIPGEETPQSDAFGDMNLGMPEYRQLHYIIEEEEEDDSDDSGDEGDGGDSEPKIVDYEVWSDYGYYQTEDQASIVDKKENSTPESPNNKDIWAANMVGDAISQPWWTYHDRIWPDQTEDLENKCWLTDANGAWNQSGEFLRSFSGENIFGFGFRVSRSRGKKDSILNAAKINVQIYGVSPDTGEDGVLLKEYTDATHDYKELKTGSIGVYQYADTFLQNVVSSKAINTIEDFPRLRVKARISDDHGESGIFTSYKREPQQNSWEEEHDTVDRTFACEMDDMRIMEVELKDSEGIVVYHADRYDSDAMEEIVNGYYDREEDLYMKVVVEQNIESGHSVKDPAIDVYIVGTNEDGMAEKTYIDTTYTLEGVEMGQGVRVTYDGIAFRPKAAEKLDINVSINEKHGEDQWRENIWNDEDDSFSKTLEGTTADLALSQDIEAYNSKNNQQDYLTFAEYLSFKFNIRHIGNGDRQTAVVGGSEINPFAKVNVKIFNADALTLNPQDYTLLYRMATQDPKANNALIMEGDIVAQSRLYPGLGSNGFASHVQAWFKNYIVQSYITATGNVAAYGHILVTGNIDARHDANHTNIRDNTVDYVQKEFFGEKNFKIVDIGVSSRNSISDDTGLAVQVAIQNAASSYNDQTVVDKTYLDIYIDDELKKTSEVEIPVGDTVVTEIIFDDIDLSECKVIEARVNTGKHQTHYEYVLRKTDASLYPDPFVDNYKSIIVCANKPNTTVCPACIIDDNIQVDNIFKDDTNTGNYTPVIDNSKYRIIFEANDGSAANTIQTVDYNTTSLLTQNTFVYPGHVFKEWNTKADGSGDTYADNGILTIGSKQSYAGNNTLNLYAQWTPVTYTMKFDGNGGTGSMAPITLTFDEAQYLPANTFQKTDYVFKEWNTRADGTGISVENGGSVMNFATTNGDTVTLYAQWIAEADCAILENFNAGAAIGLKPGDVVAENPSIISYVDYSTYGYIRVKIPTISACKDGDNGVEHVYDLFTPDWNTTDWVLVRSTVSKTVGTPSEYIWRYKTPLAPATTRTPSSVDSTRMGNRSTDLYSRVTIGNFTSAGNLRATTELVGLVLESGSGSVGTIESPGLTDQIAFNLYDTVVDANDNN